MSALETKIGELAAWRTSLVLVHPAEPAGTGMGRIEFRGTTAPVLKIPEMARASEYNIEILAAREPELREAVHNLHAAIQGIHTARELIIQRKALELANLIHGDRLNGIRAIVDQIQGGAES